MRHIIDARDFHRHQLEDLFEFTTEIRGRCEQNKNACRAWHPHELVFLVFYEPSTRTRFSFQTAALRLGMDVEITEAARQFSSAKKGETLEDTIQAMCQLEPSIIVLRHDSDGGARRAADVAGYHGIPIVNAGDGGNQHPTQALLDLYTIQSEIHRLDDLHIVMGGDLAKGRTIHSLTYLLSRFSNVRFTFIAPSEFQLPESICTHLREHSFPFTQTDDMGADFERADVVYWTRLQDERRDVPQQSPSHIITPKHCQQMREDAIIMHPLPRVGEISHDVDVDPRAAYFRQIKNGLYVRMALLSQLLRNE